ncbi:MAG: GMP synthase (glutamine-hydrolyzing) [Phycisphaerales bacterium]|jgi:GMP synthase (glutamine-hydrolysing)
MFQHDDAEGPGRLGATLRDHGFALDVRSVSPANPRDTLPDSLDGIHGVVSLGSRSSVLENTPLLDAERALLKAAHEKELPVIGICFGHQLLAQALGGTASKAETPEIGFKTVTIPAGPPQTETINAGIAWDSPQFLVHADEVSELPAGAMKLSGSADCAVQSFRVGHRSFGFQHHFEYDRSQIERMFSLYAAEFEAAGVGEDVLKAQLDEHYEMFARLADRLCLNLAAYAFPFSQLTAV